MKKLVYVLPLLGALAACTQGEQTLAASTLAGAAIGASVSSSDDKAKGAFLGGAAGLAAGTLINTGQNGNCTYQRADGSTYVSACP